jgi:hypothetical protein
MLRDSAHPQLSLSLSQTLLTGQREREKERGREKEVGRERERERGREREKERCEIFSKGMTSALAPFSYLVYNNKTN